MAAAPVARFPVFDFTSVRFFGHTVALAPDEPPRDEDDLETDWDAWEPADDELSDSDADMDWWLDDENEAESPLPEDWLPDDDAE